jgi:hypothetical protein
LIVPHVVPLQPIPDTVQVTDVFDVPVTDAVNCWLDPAAIDKVMGIAVTTTVGTIVISAAADSAGSATLVATTLTVAGEGAMAGAE